MDNNFAVTFVIKLVPVGQTPYAQDDRWVRTVTEFRSRVGNIAKMQPDQTVGGSKGISHLEIVTVLASSVPVLHELQAIFKIWLNRPRVKEIRFEATSKDKRSSAIIRADQPLDPQLMKAFAELLENDLGSDDKDRR